MSKLPEKIHLSFWTPLSPLPYLQGLITFNADNKDYHDPSKYFSNDFSSAKSCEALVGDSRTPSFPSSVHIPSLNSHHSLLSSRDEVYKEIQDVGKDNSVSSRHLFFGNMDLSPSSYHDSLEELWDEDWGDLLFIKPRVRYTQGLYFRGFRERFHPANLLFNRSTCPPCQKKDGGLSLCVAYRKLTAVARKNKYPVPPMNQLLTVFNGSSILPKIDLCGEYNLLRIKEGDENLTFFRAKYSSHQYLVMPFGLNTAPASFQNLVNDIFYDLLDFYVVVYLDEIMVFSKSEAENVTHVSTALARLRANNHFAKASKYLFHVSSVEYLETDASDYALGAVPSQLSDSGKHPIAFDSCKLLPAELNYEIHDKEPLGIVWALKRWRAFIFYLSSSFEIRANHSSLQYFMKSNILTHCQECWAEFHFSITYCPGHLASLPDALSRQDNFYPERWEDFIKKNPMNYQEIIKEDEIQASKFFVVKVNSFSNLIDSIQKALWQDCQYRSILQDLGKGKSVQDSSLDSSFKILLLKEWVVAPNDPTIQLSILQKRHDSPLD
ncbi:hypothetical protein O181_078658 [Austropuccinia psidii MF-1]|uniref:Reverse transcriptase RNase H-like domain-containing protein n=1 Tax=Austropuccinia psidii MF-1 TaxID=1389203 RepID=A0A9Q3IEU9_9BASI|nr:hypothetical protein [Austropuccinia psidii MF-1]